MTSYLSFENAAHFDCVGVRSNAHSCFRAKSIDPECGNCDTRPQADNDNHNGVGERAARVAAATFATPARDASEHCRIDGHSACKSPASTKYPSDRVLIDWVLTGLQQKLSKADHERLGQLLRDQYK